MNYGTIKKNDIANGVGVRVSLFVSGCTHHCPGCFNEEAWDFGFGKPFTGETEEEILDALAPDYIEGLTLLGGEPFEPENQKALVPFFGKGERALSAEEPVVLYGIYPGTGPSEGQPGQVRLYGPDAVHD